MSTLEDIIDSPENLEVKRALAVKMFLFDYKTEDICKLLNVSDSFVSKWKIIYENEGAGALKVNYQGGTGFLTEAQRIQVMVHIESQSHCGVEELRDYIERQFGVVYQSKQSYYDLLHAAGFSWHQTQAVNPKRDEAEVLRQREVIKKNWRRVRRKSNPVKSLFLLKTSVIWWRVTGSAPSGVRGINGWRFRSKMPNNGRRIMEP